MNDRSPPPPLRSLWIALAIWFALAALAALVLWHLRREALDAQGREIALMSLSLTDELERGLRGTEAGLQAVRSEWREGRLPSGGDDATRALKTRADLMPLVRSLWLLGPDGRVLAASDASTPPDAGAFQPPLAQLSGAGAGALPLSRPYDRSYDEGTTTMIALAQRADPDGWIVAALPATSLLGAFAAAAPVADARMVVYRDDGVRLAAGHAPTQPLAEADVARRLAERPALEQRRFRDGTEHLVGVRRIERYGLFVMLSRDLRAVLGAWRGAAQLTAATFGWLLLLLLGSAVLVRRADRRRADAQAALQAQLARASRLEALGTLAGGVAHDFNNVLAGIVGYGEMAQDAAPPGSDQARHLETVLQAALRGEALAARILAFSRGGARASTVFALEPVIEELLALLAASLKPGVVLERNLQAPGARLRGDPTRAFEAIMNLCTNALQAMPGGGMLSVGLERVHLNAPRVLSHSRLEAGDHLALSVADEGGGITPDVMEHLFEPFFTTRGAQHGTGLGLAVVHGVVAEFGGAIDVRSTPGRGACFTLYWPEAQADEPAADAPPRALPAGRGQSVLVVDDEPTLVALAVEVLTGLGYEPVGLTDPQAALRAVRDDPGRFDALITDEVMPGLTGTALTQAVRSHAPALPVLLLSGYGGALLAHRARGAGVARVLTKPLRRAELAQALAEVLG